ncbi:MAG: T9SS type A sorting domain-containing protein [Bacteroidales bacterium]|nr:T9SS type A sorting domain-containing protein [Bacteroidales bacterium]
MVNRFVPMTAFIFLLLPFMSAQDTAYYELWDIDNLENIGGHSVEFLGNPEVVNTELGAAVEFDGDGDRLLVDANPIGESKEFTVEVIFWPKASYPANTEPRFIHIQDPDDPQSKRVMIELRLNESGACYLDGFMLTDIGNLALIDETLTHPTETWLHAAITYKEGVFKTYMEGMEELSGNVAFQNTILGSDGKTSIGSRMDARNWFNGRIKTLKVTRKALAPEEFLKVSIAGDLESDGREPVRGFSLYPVPVDDLLTVSRGVSTPANWHVKIMDPAGKNLFSKQVNHSAQSGITINTSEFQPGLYLVQLMSEGISETRRIYVQH